MQKVNPKKLLPAPVSKKQASLSQKLLIPASRVTTKEYAKVEDSAATPQQRELNQQTIKLKTKFISLTKLFGEKTSLEKKKNRQKRLEAEQEKRSKREEENENNNTKFNFGSRLPKLNLPRTGFLDSIKRFLLYGLLGFAIDKFGPAIPALMGMLTKLKPAFEFFKDVTVGIVKGVVNFIDRSYKAYDFVKSKVQEIIGSDKSEDLDNFTKGLKGVINGTLIVAGAILGLAGARGPLGKLGVDRGKVGAAAAAVGLGATGLLKFRKQILAATLKKRLDVLSRRGVSRDKIAKARFRIKAAKTVAQQNAIANEIEELAFSEGKGKITRGFFDPTRTGERATGTIAELTKRPTRKILKSERDLLRKVTIGGFGGKEETRTLVQKVFDTRAEKFAKLRKKSTKGVPITQTVDEFFDDETVRIPSEEKRRETRKSEIRNIKKGQPTFSPKTGKRTVELAIPGLGRKRFAPATADALEYMAKTYGVKDFSLVAAFEDPDFYGDIIAENRREMLRAKGITGSKISGPGGRRLTPTEVLGREKPGKTPLIPDSSTRSRIPSKLRGFAGGLRGLSKGPLKALIGPFIGGIVDFVVSILFGDPIGEAAAGAVGAAVLGAVGGFLGNLILPVGGGFIGATLGGFGGDYLFRELYKNLFGIRTAETGAVNTSGRVAPATPIMPSEREIKKLGFTPVVTGRYGDKRTTGTHGGTDIAAPSGTPLVPVTDGVIVDYGDLGRSDDKRGDPNGWGNFIVYKDANGYYHLYGHLSSIIKKSGRVRRGETIATVGSTGRSSGPHLHWELGTGWSGGMIEGKMDPLSYYNVSAPFGMFKKLANLGNTNRNVASGLDDTAGYEDDQTIAFLQPIVDKVQTPAPASGGGSIVLNSNNTPSIFAPALVG